MAEENEPGGAPAAAGGAPQVSTTVDDNFDFSQLDSELGIPSASVVVSPDPSGMMHSGKIDTSLFDEQLKENPDLLDDPEQAAAAAAALDRGITTNLEEEEDDEDEEEEAPEGGTSGKSPGRSKLVKDSMIEAVKALSEKGLIDLFVDEKGELEKPIEKYTQADFQELIEMNITNKVQEAAQTAPILLFQQFPESLQAVIKHHLDGGKEDSLKNLFQQLAVAQEVFELDIEKEDDQVRVIREFENLKGILSPSEIEDEINMIKDRGDLKKVAERYKPKVDEQQAKKIQTRLDDQEKARVAKETAQKQYADTVYTALNKADLNGIPLNNTLQTMLFYGLTDNTKYTDANGRPTTALGHLLEQYQFGEKQDLGIIAEALYLLSDPEAYRNSLKDIGRKEQDVKTQGQLRTQQQRNTAGGGAGEGGTGAGVTRKPGGIQRKAGGFLSRS